MGHPGRGELLIHVPAMRVDYLVPAPYQFTTARL
jgi:hypothetical protein